MSSLNPNSIKIKKQPKDVEDDNLQRNFVCGACLRGYKSYPALYLHVKRKHNGVMPSNSKIVRAIRPPLHINIQPGRPSKPIKDIDNLCEVEASLEVAQNELMSFLGEKLLMVSDFGPKISLEKLEAKLLEISEESRDKWFLELKKESTTFLKEKKNLKDTNFDYEEEFANMNPENSVQIFAWFIAWLGRNYVKLGFIDDLCLITSKIWKVLDQTGLKVQDLDNKLVWKKVFLECEKLHTNLTVFSNKNSLLNEFIQKVCQLIGKTFEEKK